MTHEVFFSQSRYYQIAPYFCTNKLFHSGKNRAQITKPAIKTETPPATAGMLDMTISDILSQHKCLP